MAGLISINNIKDKIIILRGVQVILDRDLSVFYQIETRALKQAVKRNLERFPEEFMFKLTEKEIAFMVSQSVIPSKQYLGGSIPYAFTEQGIAMLSSVLHTKFAIQINVEIMKIFVHARKLFLHSSTPLKRLSVVETKLLEHDNAFNKIFDVLDRHQETEQGIFFEGQLFDSHKFISDLIRKAKKKILLVDNFVDDRTLNLFNKRAKTVEVTIFTKFISKSLTQDLLKYNSQYSPIDIKVLKSFHDRFLIIDEIIYHIGASLKDLGKKCFAFSKMESLDLIKKLK